MDFDQPWRGAVSRVSAAVLRGDLAQLRALLEAGASANSPDNRGWQPIHVAAACHRPRAFLRPLIGRGEFASDQPVQLKSPAAQSNRTCTATGSAGLGERAHLRGRDAAAAALQARAK